MRSAWRRSCSSATPESAASPPADLVRLVQEEGALALFDGLDEVLVHLAPPPASASPAREDWLLEFLVEQPRVAAHYEGVPRELLKEDLRTATFLVREGEDRFRFAHSFLQEFLLAGHLHTTLREGRVQDWELPPPSPETLGLLGQLLAEGCPARIHPGRPWSPCGPCATTTAPEPARTPCATAWPPARTDTPPPRPPASSSRAPTCAGSTSSASRPTRSTSAASGSPALGWKAAGSVGST